MTGLRLWKVLLPVGAMLLALPAWGQITLSGAVNGASYLNSQLPNGNLAQGVIFVAFGKNLGPAAIQHANSFPLPTTLAGTSIKVTVGGTSVDCILLYTVAGQVAAILPSDTPAGTGTMVATYQGQSTAPLNITVVQNSFGVFSVSQNGSGVGVFTEVTTSAANSPVAAANPGQMIDIWGTGLGPVTGNEAGGPLPGNLSGLDVEAYVGAAQAQILYQGRSGCCAGLDQVRIVVPQVSGCFLPVYVVVNGVVSNFTTMSVATSGSVCSDPSGNNSTLWATAKANGGLRTADATLTRFRTFTGTTSNDTYSAGVNFVKVPYRALLEGGASAVAGTCNVVQFPGGSPVQDPPLSAGPVTFSGPAGTYTLYPSQAGYQGLTFIPGSAASGPGIIADGTILQPGTYTFTATAGTDVGAFTTTVTLPTALDWTNRVAVTSAPILRSKPLTITWSNGFPGALVYIVAQSLAAPSVGASLTCYADAAAGSFTVPAAILSALPPSYKSGGVPARTIGVYQSYLTNDFTPPGIDAGTRIFADGFFTESPDFQ